MVSSNGEPKLIQPTTGLEVTEMIRTFSTQFLSSLSDVDGFILKYRSPSCGMKDVKVYSGLHRDEQYPRYQVSSEEPWSIRFLILPSRTKAG